MKKRLKRLFLLFWMMLIPDGYKKADILKKKKYFYAQGENCFWIPFKLPPEPELIILGNNVKVASDVTFITHDVIHTVYNDSNESNDRYSIYLGAIVVGNNVFIGAQSIILPDIKIGDNCIISAGSVVTKDLESGYIYGGVPAKKIGLTKDLYKKRSHHFDPKRKEEQYDTIWSLFEEKRLH